MFKFFCRRSTLIFYDIKNYNLENHKKSALICGKKNLNSKQIFPIFEIIHS